MEILNKIELIFFTTKDGKKHSMERKKYPFLISVTQ